ncbi:copper resistance protein CopA [Psychromonas sp. Urea-02u-13]|nr:copper resistance protein CopA [Psychromonas sp. Urea-02u-13]
MKKTKLALALTGALFLTLPVSQVFAHEKHCDIKETQLGETMKHIKSELRAYVKGFKKDDANKMQKHALELIKLTERAINETPMKIKMMGHEGMPNMEGMDHSKMEMADMKGMDHSKMDMADMKGMDHSKMDMADMKDMDHSKMDHGDMKLSSPEHDMSKMPSMKGMSAEQHHQHMMYMQGMQQLKALFETLANTSEKNEIKQTLGEIKEHSKKSHQQYRLDCS